MGRILLVTFGDFLYLKFIFFLLDLSEKVQVLYHFIGCTRFQDTLGCLLFRCFFSLIIQVYSKWIFVKKQTWLFIAFKRHWMREMNIPQSRYLTLPWKLRWIQGSWSLGPIGWYGPQLIWWMGLGLWQSSRNSSSSSALSILWKTVLDTKA